MEVGVNGKDAQKEEERERNPGSPLCLPGQDHEHPQAKEAEKQKDQDDGRGWRVEAAQIKPKGIREKNGNERKAKSITHRRLQTPQGIGEAWNNGPLE